MVLYNVVVPRSGCRACYLQLACAESAGVCITFSRMQCRSCDSMEKPVPMCVHMQMGTLGAGNHYAEIQVVEEVFDKAAARKMGIDKVGQVCIMIHSGSRGLGHQVTYTAPFWNILAACHADEKLHALRNDEKWCISALSVTCVRLSYACKVPSCSGLIWHRMCIMSS